MSDDTRKNAAPAWHVELLDRVREALQSDPEHQDNERLTKAAVVVAVGGSVLLALILIVGGGGGEEPVRANAIDDPHALRPASVRWNPGDGQDGATTGAGGMAGGGGYGGGLMQRLGLSRPCTNEPPPLKEAVKRTSGTRMITGQVGPMPCGK